MSDYHIMFYGGSGGHICSHLVLQSGQHYCAYHEKLFDKNMFDQTFAEIKQRNWNLMNQDRWREHHSWPNNELTKESNIAGMHKMFFTCAPNESRWPEGDPDTYSTDLQDHKQYLSAKTVLIWTDIDTQAALAKYKKSRWFRQNHLGVYYYWKTYSPFEAQWLEVYAKHRLTQWPNISIKNIPNLDATLIDQLKSVPEILNFFTIAESEQGFQQWKRSLAMENYQGFVVERSVALMLQESTVAIRLQDVAKTQGRALTDLLDIPWCQDHAQLVDRWLDLHPESIRNRLLDKDF